MSALAALLEASAPYAWIDQNIVQDPDASDLQRVSVLMHAAFSALYDGTIRASLIDLPWEA